MNYTQYWANNTNAPSGTQSVSDAQMVAMLQSAFNSGKLTYDANTLYAIFTSGQGQPRRRVRHAVLRVPHARHRDDQRRGEDRALRRDAVQLRLPAAPARRASAANGNGDPGADYEVNTLAHEIEETTTDMMGNAWFDNRGYENADKCAWTWGTTYTTAAGGTANMNIGGKDFLVQQNWMNAGSRRLRDVATDRVVER